MDENAQPTDQFYGLPQEPKKRSMKSPFFILVIIMIIGIIGFVGYSMVNSQNENVDEEAESEEIITPTFTPTPSPQETPSTTISITPTSKIQPTPTKSVSTSGKSDDKSSLTIEILNGSGVAGVAGKAKSLLTDLGYNITSTGNADNFEYEQSVIEIKASKSSFLKDLEKDLSKDYVIGETSSTLSASNQTDVRIIIGKE